MIMKIDFPKFDKDLFKKGTTVHHKYYDLRMTGPTLMQILPKPPIDDPKYINPDDFTKEMFDLFQKICNSKPGRMIKLICYKKDGYIYLITGV
jgi:hypothetical protein